MEDHTKIVIAVMREEQKFRRWIMAQPKFAHNIWDDVLGNSEVLEQYIAETYPPETDKMNSAADRPGIRPSWPTPTTKKD